MKINYNILWVEDNLSWYGTTLELFRDTLSNDGFELIAERKDNIQQIRELIAQDGLKKFDMLLVDFTLKDSETGDEIIKLIRENEIYTDVLFYSSAPDNVKDSMHKNGLEGVYTADRKDIETKFDAVFKTTIKKIQEINAMRGLIVGETSELDVEIEKIYYQLIEIPIDDETKTKVEKIFRKDYKEMQKNYLKQCKAKRDNHASDFKTYFSLSDSFRKWDILKELVSLNVPDGFNLELFKKYYEEVIDIRNKFAHVKATEEGGVIKLKGKIEKHDIEFTEARCVAIRKSLIEHRRNIETLRKAYNQ